MEKNTSSIKRLLSAIRKVDREIEAWVHHLIHQIENENHNQSNQTD